MNSNASVYFQVYLIVNGKRVKKKKSSLSKSGSNPSNPVWNEALIFNFHASNLQNAALEVFHNKYLMKSLFLDLFTKKNDVNFRFMWFRLVAVRQMQSVVAVLDQWNKEKEERIGKKCSMQAKQMQHGIA